MESLAKELAALGIPSTHVDIGLTNLVAGNRSFRSILVNRRLPDEGWSDTELQRLLYTLSSLDTNQPRWCGVGEREGRVYSSLVATRHFGLAHGTGRSGDLTEAQPKAVGSTILVKLTRLLLLDAVRRGSGLTQSVVGDAIVLPLCTGMSMALVLTTLRQQAPDKSVVLWSRIDQKSCFKAIAAAGLECVVIETKMEGDEVVTDLDAMRAALVEHGPNVLAVLSTTSCFAPRVGDRIDEIAKLCEEFSTSHVVNNAYGLQCAATSKLLKRAVAVGTLTAVVCSTDKNFMVPVGGAMVLSPHSSIIAKLAKIYAGRASSSPMVDLFITLLSMGLNGYRRLLDEREKLVETFPQRLSSVAEKYGERVLHCSRNTISFGMTLDRLSRAQRVDESDDEYLCAVGRDVSRIGAMLFSRCVSGTRVVPRGERKAMGGYEFVGFGSSHAEYPHAYLTAACAIGVTAAEIDEFLTRLDKTLKEFHKKKK